jgi:hypothetical protein
VDQRRGLVRLITPLPHGRRASPGLQRDRSGGNDVDLERVVGGGVVASSIVMRVLGM